MPVMPSLPAWLWTLLLLLASNTFMTFAWYYHLKHKGWSLLTA
ncbi:MAG: DMT family protein, partial [Phycisphaerae bacterium]|nr:DMT family protein [Phycisphaerae bacterium]